MSTRRITGAVVTAGLLSVGVAFPESPLVGVVFAQGCTQQCPGIVWGAPNPLPGGFKFVIEQDPNMQQLNSEQLQTVKDSGYLAGQDWKYESERRTNGPIHTQIEWKDGSQGSNDVKIVITDTAQTATYDYQTRVFTLPRSVSVGSNNQYRLAIFRHEFGHALGAAGSECSNSVMSPTSESSYRAYFTECDQTRLSAQMGEIRRDDDADGWFHDQDCDDNNSAVQEYEECQEWHCENVLHWQWVEGACLEGSPIILDVRGNGFSLTNREDGVLFDLDADGVKTLIPWTSAGSDDAWLVLDRNGNGLIDDGTELFGNFTPQSGSQHPNGFVALAVFDEVAAGGNENGWLDRQDAVYSVLRLWRDINHDGVSQPRELRDLATSGVRAISLDYSESRRVDQWGNAFRYRAKVVDGRGRDIGQWAYRRVLRGSRPERASVISYCKKAARPLVWQGRRTWVAWCAWLSITLGCVSVAAAQQPSDSPSVAARIAALEARQAELEKELATLKARLQAAIRGTTEAVRPPQPVPGDPVPIAGLPMQGSETAAIVVIEFADFQCPFCRKFYQETWPTIDRTYVQTGKIRYVFQHLPLERLHPHSLGGASAAECAGQQGKFWAMRDHLFRNPTTVAKELVAQGALLGLDTPQFQSCLVETGVVAVRRQASAAARLGISSTPTFLIGVLEGDSVRVVRRLSGAQPFALFRNLLDPLLGSAER